MRGVVLLYSLLAMCVVNAQDRSLIENADSLFMQGKYSEASTVYQQISQSSAEPCFECELGLARVDIQLGKVDRSIERLQETGRPVTIR